MTAYLLGRVEITDPERYKEYMKKTPGVIEKYGGKFIVRGGDVVTLEGAGETRRLVLIEFPSMEKAPSVTMILNLEAPCASFSFSSRSSISAFL